MNKTVIATDKSPAAIGPYSQAIEVGGMIYTSGVIGVDPKTGEAGVTIEEQTRQVFENLRGLLADAGSSLEQAVKTTVFIKNMDDFGKVNDIYASYFTGDFPARSCVEVARLPKDLLIEVEVIALKN
ncbi:MAG: RidA family protein [Clostridiales bacterium]|uniref:RidA family protein n=1 Tax=Candidatus Anaerobutyricum stercoripullorum TaxID=2838456 RepID=A0A9D2BEK7_9FIRM|nr:RidA family protein [Clostridiales bacterium]HIX72612.1 RidA family protein [Candidatus Anaerobutyricum stercoripullorum]